MFTNAISGDLSDEGDHNIIAAANLYHSLYSVALLALIALYRVSVDCKSLPFPSSHPKCCIKHIAILPHYHITPVSIFCVG